MLIAAQGSPVKVIGTPSKSSNGTELKDTLEKFYKDSGLDSVAKEVTQII